jgi:hypothetical protein
MTVATEVEVYGGQQTTQIGICNLRGQALTDGQAIITLRPLLGFWSLFFFKINSFSRPKFDLSLDTSLVFFASNIPHGDSFLVEMANSVDMEAIPHPDVGCIFRNNAMVFNSQEDNSKISPAHHTLYPDFSVSENSQIHIGSALAQRTIHIITGQKAKKKISQNGFTPPQSNLSIVGTKTWAMVTDTVVLSGHLHLFWKGLRVFFPISGIVANK